ncbi:hypothetical protein PsorP6_015795 [Peronosclerospora sorghi]|uniref:Uncharacterized protein n=1 Tax=Peronosclerospora sorghi TaxID=230839 RepID=A0ACC0WPL6_9STRA|nr:hypothetical protein PsorP6_015795 [Peronosclerospora sorghi]
MAEPQWIDPATSPAYSGKTTSSARDETSRAPEATCRFLHNQCDKDLFTSEYLRSNKASGHKVPNTPHNLRCFPHCCGGHNPKSFCGSGLVVECFLPTCHVVLGRFEEVAQHQPTARGTTPPVDTSAGHAHLVVGRAYNRHDLLADVKMPDQPFGRWFRGTALPRAPTATSTSFLLNGNRQSWHYGWQSSRLNCKNLHVFQVYVFETSGGNDNTLTCMAALASPAFRISSSRKARKTFRAPPSQLAQAHDGASPSTPLPQPARTIPHARGTAGAHPVTRMDDFVAGTAGHPLAASNPAATYASLQLSPSARPPTGFLAGQRDPARRERKRLTRSSSLKTDYFSTVSFPALQQQQQFVPAQMRWSLSHPPHFEMLDENRVTAASTTLPGVGSFLNGSGRPSDQGESHPRVCHSRRSSLAALPMPISHAMNLSRPHQRTVPVLTPITGMMQLRLENRSPYSSQSLSSTPLSSSSSVGEAAPPMRLTATALHQHAYTSARPYACARRDMWSSSVHDMIPEGGGGIPMPTPDSYLNRKRNRSTDSDKAITAAIEASEKIRPTLSPVSSPRNMPPMVAPVPTDSELYRRARILQLAFTIVKRIHRFEEVAAKQKEPHPKVYRHSFEMITPPMPTPVPTTHGQATPRSQRKKCTLVQIPLSNPKLLYLCSNLVTVCTSLLSTGLLEDVRQKLHDCAQAGRGALAAYAQLVDLLNDAVEAQVARLPRRMHKSWGDAESADEGEWDLYEMLKSCEPWLVHEPWWVVLDTDDQEQAGDKEEGAWRPLPYLNVFAEYYRAIREAVPSPQDVKVADSLRKAAIIGAIGLTGEWNRHGEADEHHLQQPQRVASVRSATAASSLSWLARRIHAHTTKVLHITETDTTMTLSLPHSLVSADAVFLLQLDQQEPTVLFPQDYFPFGWSRKRSLMAYRAWRVRGIGDSNGSAVAVQFMRWPDEQDVEMVENDEEDEEEDDDEADESPEEPEEEPVSGGGRLGRLPKRLRTRITIYFSVFSSNTLQLRTIVEASLAPVAASGSMQPTETDMLRYFKSPSSWEMRSQISQQYWKNR